MDEDVYRSTSMTGAELGAFLSVMPIAMIVADTSGIIRAASNMVSDQFGHSNRELIGANLTMLMSPTHAKRHDGYLKHYLETGERRIIGNPRVENAIHKNGHAIAVEIHVSETRIDGELYFLGFLRVLAQQESNRQEIQSLMAELAHMSRVSAMGALATAIAHELNQPLTVISNFAQGARDMLKNRSDAEGLEQVIEVLDDCGDQAVRAGQLLHRLREFVMSADPQDESVSVEKIVDDSVSLVLINGYRRTTEVERDLPDDLPAIWIDPLQGEQVLFNLIRNAFQAMAPNEEQIHKVLISARNQGDGKVELSVEDNGPGIDPEIRDTLFDSFVTTRSGGMGIGLAICRQIVEAYGGRLRAGKSETLGGARFSFTFPTKPSEELMD